MTPPLSDDEIVELLKDSDTVPEPSPLFWDHAARRVRAAIEPEPPRRSPLVRRLVWTGGGLAAASLAVALTLSTRPSLEPARTVPVAQPAVVIDMPAPDDDSWDIVEALGGELDVDAAARAGLVAPGATIDRAVQALDDEERRELASLLQRALDGPEI